MKRLLIAVLVLNVSFVFLTNLGFCENGAQPQQSSSQPQVVATEEPVTQQAALAQAEDTTEFSYGTVKSVSEGQLVVAEYDYDNDKDVDITYSVPANVTLDGVAKLSEIVVGNAVDIDYVVKDGQKVVSVISVEKGTAETENEDTALDTNNEENAEG